MKDDLVRSHGESQLDTFAELGHSVVTAIIETAQDDRVCAKCRVLEGREVPIEQARGLIPAHPNCLESNVYVLTNRGWVLFKDLNIKTDTFLSEDPETRKSEFVKAKQLVQYHLKGDLIRFSGRSFSLGATPDHNMYMRRHLIGAVGQRYTFTPAKDALRPFFTIPTGIVSAGYSGSSSETKKIGTDAIPFQVYVKFMAVWLTGDGTFEDDNMAHVLSYLEDPINEHEFLEFPQWYFPDDGGSYIDEPDLCFDKGIFDFLMALRKNLRIPDDIKNASISDITTFLRIWLQADQWAKKNQTSDKLFHTTSWRVASDLCFLILRVGGRPIVTKEILDPSISTILYMVQWDTDTLAVSETLKSETVAYDDIVYCVELEKWHTIYVMQNGKTTWTGNCRCAWKPVPPRLILSDKEKEKRKTETVRETIDRLQKDLGKFREDEEKTAKRSASKPDNAELRGNAEKAKLNRLKMEAQILERRAAQMRSAVEYTRHIANDFIQSQAEYQRELESKRVDNDGYSDTGFAKYVIERERLVEKVRDIIVDLPDVDNYLKEADNAYNKERDRRLRRHEELQEDDDFAIDIEIIALREYLDKLAIFAQDSKLVLLTGNAVRLIPQLIAEAAQLDYLAEHPTPPDIHVKKTHRQLNDEMSKGSFVNKVFNFNLFFFVFLLIISFHLLCEL